MQETPNIKKDRLLTQCEGLILRGYDSPSEVSKILAVSYNSAKAYIAVIRQRWTDSTTVDDLQAKRQELVRRVEQVVKEAWNLKSKAKNTLEAVGAMRTVLMGIERLEKLHGIDALALPQEKPKEIQLFEWVEETRALPASDREMVMKKIKARLANIKEGSKTLTNEGF